MKYQCLFYFGWMRAGRVNVASVIAKGNRADGFWDSRSEFGGMPGYQGVAAKCSASSAATWSAACSGSQCEAPSSSVKR